MSPTQIPETQFTCECSIDVNPSVAYCSVHFPSSPAQRSEPYREISLPIIPRFDTESRPHLSQSNPVIQQCQYFSLGDVGCPAHGASLVPIQSKGRLEASPAGNGTTEEEKAEIQVEEDDGEFGEAADDCATSNTSIISMRGGGGCHSQDHDVDDKTPRARTPINETPTDSSESYHPSVDISNSTEACPYDGPTYDEMWSGIRDSNNAPRAPITESVAESTTTSTTGEYPSETSFIAAWVNRIPPLDRTLLTADEEQQLRAAYTRITARDRRPSMQPTKEVSARAIAEIETQADNTKKTEEHEEGLPAEEMLSNEQTLQLRTTYAIVTEGDHRPEIQPTKKANAQAITEAKKAEHAKKVAEKIKNKEQRRRYRLARDKVIEKRLKTRAGSGMDVRRPMGTDMPKEDATDKDWVESGPSEKLRKTMSFWKEL